MEAALQARTDLCQRFVLPNPIAICLPYLISEATDYVAADYMRHANERCRVQSSGSGAGVSTRTCTISRKQPAAEQYKHVDMARELGV